jgi:AraC-like DNA-binding protein
MSDAGKFKRATQFEAKAFIQPDRGDVVAKDVQKRRFPSLLNFSAQCFHEAAGQTASAIVFVHANGADLNVPIDAHPFAGHRNETLTVANPNVVARFVRSFAEWSGFGLLDQIEHLFRQRYPAVNLDDSRMVVASHRVVTAGSAMGHLDLALWLLRQTSPELATLVARFMLIDKRSSQAEYIIPDHLAHADPLVGRFERWARDNLASGFSLQAAAAALAVGPRTLQRRTEAVLGKSPLAFFQDLRIERAQNLVSIGYDLEKIASEVGYSDSATLRTLLRRRLGRGVRELRAEMR